MPKTIQGLKAAIAQGAVIREDINGEPWLYLTPLYAIHRGRMPKLPTPPRRIG